MKKHFVLAMQPHENSHTSTGKRHTIAFCATLVLLMGLAFSMSPDIWQENIRVGLLRYAYGWQTSPLISPSEATAWYSDIFDKVPKTGCNDAREKDWRIICPIASSQMSYGIDCDHPNLETKAMILKNIEKSKTTSQYMCLYGN